MRKTIRSIGLSALLALWVLLSALLWFGQRQTYSSAERRKLAQAPALSAGSVVSGTFMSDFEDFVLDQFPGRDTFRQLKALFHYNVLQQQDNNGLYLVGDTVAKLDYPLQEASVSYGAGRLQNLYDTWLKDTRCTLYAAMVPDKGYYLAEANGYPAMDYSRMEMLYRQATSWAEYVDLTELLSAQDYYRTDTHWRQERLLDVAAALCQAMGATVPMDEDYTRVALETPFYGVYFGQAALPIKPETMYLLESDLLADCTVTDPITGTVSPVYNLEKCTSPDLYDVYLSGAQPLLVITNPRGESGKELVIFRDSFGSALAPLLVADYSQVTLVDTRYIHPDRIGDYVDFQEQDVLFLYSTLLLNSSGSLK